MFPQGCGYSSGSSGKVEKRKLLRYLNYLIPCYNPGPYAAGLPSVFQTACNPSCFRIHIEPKAPLLQFAANTISLDQASYQTRIRSNYSQLQTPNDPQSKFIRLHEDEGKLLAEAIDPQDSFSYPRRRKSIFSNMLSYWKTLEILTSIPAKQIRTRIVIWKHKLPDPTDKTKILSFSNLLLCFLAGDIHLFLAVSIFRNPREVEIQ